MDELPAAEDARVRFRLGAARRAAVAAEDPALVEAIDAEGNSFVFFSEADLPQPTVPVRSYFNDGMISYLRRRLATTPDVRLFARYMHVIAEYSGDPKDQASAIEAYASAVDYYLSANVEDPSSDFHGLRKLLPLMFIAATKYGLRDRVLPLLVQAMQNPNPYLRKSVLELMVDDPKIGRDTLNQIRSTALSTIRDLRASPDPSDPRTLAEAGMRLDAKIGREENIEWFAAAAAAYQETARDATEPFTKLDAFHRAANCREAMKRRPSFRSRDVEWTQRGVTDLCEILAGRLYEVTFGKRLFRISIAERGGEPNALFVALYDELVSIGDRQLWARLPTSGIDFRTPTECLAGAVSDLAAYIKRNHTD